MKTFILIFLLITNVSLIGQVKTSGYVELGYVSERMALNQNNWVTLLHYPSAGYSDITLNFELKNIIWEQTLINTFGHNKGGKTFKPLDIYYKTRIYYKWNSINIGYEHMCLHPIINQHNELEFITRRLSHDKVFVRLKFNFN